VLIRIDIFRHEVAVPIELPHDAPTRHGMRAVRAAQGDQEVPIGQQIPIIARSRRQVPLMDDRAGHVHEVSRRIAQRRIQGEAWGGARGIVMR